MQTNSGNIQVRVLARKASSILPDWIVLVRYSCKTDEQSGPDTAGVRREFIRFMVGKKSVAIWLKFQTWVQQSTCQAFDVGQQRGHCYWVHGTCYIGAVSFRELGSDRFAQLVLRGRHSSRGSDADYAGHPTARETRY